MDIRELYFDPIPAAVEWIDCSIFLAACAWLLASVEILSATKSEKCFFSTRSRIGISAILLCGAGLNTVLLIGLNLFPLPEEKIIPYLLGIFGLGGLFSFFLILRDLFDQRDWKLSEWLCYTIIANLLAYWFYDLHTAALGGRRHADKLIVVVACLSAFVAIIALIRVKAWTHFRKKTDSRLREFASTALIITLTVVWLNIETRLIATNYFERIVSVAAISTRSLPLEAILRLRGIPEDAPTENYQRVSDSLRYLIDDLPLIHSAYLWSVAGERLIFLADGSKVDLSQPGDAFREADPKDKEYYSRRKAYALAPFRDPWGLWVSANYPIIDPVTGKNFCWLGLDFPADNYFSSIGRPRLQIMSLAGMILLLLSLYRIIASSNEVELVFERESQMIRESERRKIAGQLHDDLGQLITAIGFEAATLGHFATHLSGAADATLQRLRNLVEKAGLRNRDQAFGLSPYLANPAQFSQELRRFVLDLAVLLRLGVTLDLPSRPLACASADAAADLIHIVQESFTNAAKHGNRQKVHLALTREKHTWLLLIENEEDHPDGETAVARPGIGLRIMEARVADMGGKFFFRHYPDGRALVSCEFPKSLLTEQPE